MGNILTIMIIAFLILATLALLPLMLRAFTAKKATDPSTLSKQDPKVKEGVKLSNGATLRILML